MSNEIKEFWSYLMEDGRVYPLGFFNGDVDIAWPDIWAAANELAKKKGTEPSHPMNEDDLTEVTACLTYCFNAKQNAAKRDYYMIGGFIDKADVPRLRALVEQHPDFEFLQDALGECEIAESANINDDPR